MSDRIGILKDGRLMQVGSPSEIYNEPSNKFVAQFMGEVNTLEVEAAGEASVRNLADGREYRVDRPLDGFERGFLIVRPEVVKIGELAHGLANRIEGTLFNDYSLGSRIQYQVRVEGDGVHWLVERLQDEPFEGEPGDSVVIGWRPEDGILVRE
jgi:spermidine/putrescine transport system ATP-binding protein